MIQVLPGVPTFGSKLAAALGQAGQDIGKGIQQRRAQTALQGLLGGNQQAAPGQEMMPGQQPTSAINPMAGVNAYNLASQAYGPEGGKFVANALLAQQQEAQATANRRAENIQKQNLKTEHELISEHAKPFWTQLGADEQDLPNAQFANERVIDAIKNGDIGPGSAAWWGQVAKDAHMPESIQKLFVTTDQKEFNHAVKTSYGHTMKTLFKGTTTQREIDLAQSMEAEIGVKPEANLAAAWATQAELDFRGERLRLANEAIERSIPRSKVQAYIKKNLDSYRQQLSDEYFHAISVLRENGLPRS